MLPTIANTSGKEINFKWRGFTYVIAAGETLTIPQTVYEALIKRHPNEARMVKAKQKNIKEKGENAFDR